MAVCTRVSTPTLLEEVLQGQAVHDRAQHAHVVGTGTVHTALRELGAAEVIAAPDDHRHLHAGRHDVADLPSDGGHDVGVDAEAAVTGECLAGQLQQHPAIAAPVACWSSRAPHLVPFGRLRPVAGQSASDLADLETGEAGQA